jgi:hypothetical protein
VENRTALSGACRESERDRGGFTGLLGIQRPKVTCTLTLPLWGITPPTRGDAFKWHGQAGLSVVFRDGREMFHASAALYGKRRFPLFD